MAWQYSSTGKTPLETSGVGACSYALAHQSIWPTILSSLIQVSFRQFPSACAPLPFLEPPGFFLFSDRRLIIPSSCGTYRYSYSSTSAKHRYPDIRMLTGTPRSNLRFLAPPFPESVLYELASMISGTIPSFARPTIHHQKVQANSTSTC